MDNSMNYLPVPGLGGADVGLGGKATEFFQKYKKQVLLGAAVAALGAGAYLLMRGKRGAKGGTHGLSGTNRRRYARAGRGHRGTKTKQAKLG